MILYAKINGQLTCSSAVVAAASGSSGLAAFLGASLGALSTTQNRGLAGCLGQSLAALE